MQYFLYQFIELFLSKHHFACISTSFGVLFYLEYMKKIQSQTPEACICSTCDPRKRCGLEIQANY